MSFVDAAHWIARYTGRQALGWAANTVIPANSVHPSGTQTTHYATVQLREADDDMQLVKAYADVPPVSPSVTPTNQSTETLSHVHIFTASINVYRNTKSDSQGLATFGNQAYSDALSLHSKLQSEPIQRLMCAPPPTGFGRCIGYAGSSKVRDLTALVEGNWENRAQVDIEFVFPDDDVSTIGIYDAFQFQFKVQQPDNSIDTMTFEVTQ
jgi:hypothetical protein